MEVIESYGDIGLAYPRAIYHRESCCAELFSDVSTSILWTMIAATRIFRLLKLQAAPEAPIINLY